MKNLYLILAVAVSLAGLSSAQTLPACAQSCVNKYTSGSEIGNCSSLDVACICSSPTFLSSIACCLVGECDTADQEASVVYAEDICKTAGVTNLPAAVSCSSTATAASATSSSSTSSVSSVTGSSTTSSASATATKNAGPQNVGDIGAGLLCGLAAAVAIL